MQNQLPKAFDRGTQKLIGIFGFLIAFPILEIPVVGISVSFPVFIWICIRVISRNKSPLFALSGRLDVLMFIFVLMAIVTIALAPPADNGGVDLLIRDFKSVLYLIYWFLVYLFFRRWYGCLNIVNLSRYTLMGIFVSTAFILLGNRDGAFFVLGPLALSQNSYAFNAVACVGVGAAYLLNRFGWKSLIGYAFFMVYPMVLSDSRSGSVIMLLQCLGIILIGVLGAQKRIRIALIATGIILLATFSFVFPATKIVNKISWAVGSAVEPYSAEVATLLKNRESVLERDKSWQVRRTQVEKGIGLFKEYPITGVGWGHWRYVRGEIAIWKYPYLNRNYDSYALIRSSHNSYIQVLAETGLIGFVPFVLIQVLVFWMSLRLVMVSQSIAIALPLSASLIGISIYFWTISAVTGAVWYFILGLFSGAVEAQGAE